MKINIQNYETYFLLYIDNELPVVEKREVERFIKEHPALANELNTLKQTVLAADHILFEEKAILYRYQEMESSLPVGFKQSLYREEAKVVEGFFTRSKIKSIASIAAILLLLLGYRSYFTVPINNEKGISKNKNTTIQSLDSKRVTSSTADNIIENNLETKYKSEATAPSASNMFTSNNLPLTEETTFIPEETKLLDLINTAPEIMNVKIKETTINSIPENITTATIENVNPNPTITNNANKDQEQAYYNIDTEEEERGIYIANFEIDGNKLRGVTRRINALFRRNKNEKQK
jgi:hypothetical protein